MEAVAVLLAVTVSLGLPTVAELVTLVIPAVGGRLAGSPLTTLALGILRTSVTVWAAAAAVMLLSVQVTVLGEVLPL